MSIRDRCGGKPPFDSGTNMLSSGSLYICLGLDFLHLRFSTNTHTTVTTANITNPPTTAAPAIIAADESPSLGCGCGVDDWNTTTAGAGTVVGVAAGLDRGAKLEEVAEVARLEEAVVLDLLC